jgi:hydroxymethylbilane synthase
MAALLRIGTRGSPLALAMTATVARLLAARHPELDQEGAIETVPITTTGDRIQDRPLDAIGGKGLFTKEIDEALLAGRVDIAVNSAKDLPTILPAGLIIGAIPEREDPRDVFVSPRAKSLAALPAGARVGTASLRRRAQVLHRRPDLQVVVFRGNVETRLRKLAAGEADATLLALAGLKRLGREDAVTALVPVEEILPAVGQGAMALTCREADARVRGWLAELDHAETSLAVTAERALLDRLDGSCHTPIAALATKQPDGKYRLSALLAKTDGSAVLETERSGIVRKAADAVTLGREAGDDLLGRAGPGFLD